jgi:hypothetical protein
VYEVKKIIAHARHITIEVFKKNFGIKIENTVCGREKEKNKFRI